jgi:hypothetical protein
MRVGVYEGEWRYEGEWSKVALYYRVPRRVEADRGCKGARVLTPVESERF